MRLHLMEGRRLISAHTPGAEPVLRGASLIIRQGDLIAVLGAPHTGKSTLLRILGLLDRPASGQLWLANRLITDLPEAELAALRRTQISLAIMSSAPLLLVDEPSPDGVSLLVDRNRSGQTALFCTADPRLASRAPVIYRLRNGLLHRLDVPQDL